MNRVGFHATHETQSTKMIFLDSVDCRQSTESRKIIFVDCVSCVAWKPTRFIYIVG